MGKSLLFQKLFSAPPCQLLVPFPDRTFTRFSYGLEAYFLRSCKGRCKCMETQEQVVGRKKSHVTDLPHREKRVRVVGV